MKKILLAFVIAIVTQVSVFAQSYSFSATTGTYTDLVSPTVVSGTAPWTDTIFATIQIGFPFNFQGNTYSTLYLDNYGDAYMFEPTTQTLQGIYAFDTSLEDRGTGTTTSASPFSYTLTGTAGSRILKIEWKNVGFSTGGATDFANAQLWIYEGSNKIEVRYGASSIANPSSVFAPYTGVAAGLAYDIDLPSYAASGLFLLGSPSAPTVSMATTNTLSYARVTGIPANGTIYTFTKNAAGIAKDQLATAVSVFPNPATDVISFKGLADLKVSAPVTVSDITGKVLVTETLGASQQLNISSLPKGSYMVKILTDKGQVVKHIVKQ